MSTIRWQGMRRSDGIRFILAIVSALACASPFAALAQDPVKLEISPSAQAVGVGAAVTLDVSLRAADNSVAVAPKPMEIRFDVASPSGPSALGSILLEAGQSTVQVPLQVTVPGLWSIRALNSELMEGGTVVLGKPLGDQSSLPDAVDPADAEVAMNTGDSETLTRGLGDVIGGEVAPAAGPSLSVDLAVAAPTATALQPARIELTATPVRRLLANGSDHAMISAFVLGDAADRDIRIQLVATLGTISPNPLVIRKGDFVGEATLTANEVGHSKVRVVATQPPVAILDDAPLDVDFAPPIARLELHASPPNSSLLDAPQIIVQLLNADGETVAADEPRTISLRLEDGNGDIQPVVVEVPAGKFEGRATFMPWWMGSTTVVANTPNMLERSTKLTVKLPTMLIALTAVGGLIGGVIAFWTNRARWWRIVIGSFAGFVLYWAMIFGLLQSVPRNVALNPLSAFAVALIGGYVGPQLLALMAKKFGITGGTGSG